MGGGGCSKIPTLSKGGGVSYGEPRIHQSDREKKRRSDQKVPEDFISSCLYCKTAWLYAWAQVNEWPCLILGVIRRLGCSNVIISALHYFLKKYVNMMKILAYIDLLQNLLLWPFHYYYAYYFGIKQSYFSGGR